MAPLQHKLRRALGTFKDQTSISILKVAGSASTDLDIAIVKATSHEEAPIPDRYVQEILHLTSFSRGYVNTCISSLAKRLSKTHNWVVAIKALIVTHRLLRDGDPSFEQELLYYSRHGMRVLNLSNFRDDSHVHAWDYSAFVRTYALFLDEKLDLNLSSGKTQSEGRNTGDRGRPIVNGYIEYEGHREDGYGFEGRPNEGRYGYDTHREDGYGSGYGSRGDGTQGSGNDRRRDDEYGRDRHKENGYGGRDGEKKITQIKDMNPKDVLERIPLMQRLVGLVLACRPTGAARTNRLVQIALHPVVRESFQLYADVCEAMAVILDAFFELEHADGVKAFELYAKGAKQVDELALFYKACKDYGVCRSSEYPVVQRVSVDLLENMEEFLRNRSDSDRPRRKSPEPRSKSPEPIVEDTSYDITGIKALPAPPGPELEPDTKEEAPPIQTHEREPDLLNLNDDEAVSAEEHGDRLALALFSDSGSSAAQGRSNGVPADRPLAGWELALVELPSDLAKPATNELAGGFDNLLLTSMYDQALANQKRATMMIPAGSASSVALPGQPTTSYLALPAPLTSVQAGDDPFAASMSVPPPPYVQMADMRQKQQFLVQEQQAWYQYQRDGMQGYNGLMKFQNPMYTPSFPHNYHLVPHYGATYY